MAKYLAISALLRAYEVLEIMARLALNLAKILSIHNIGRIAL
jgi:hypothetical protein